MKIIFVLCVATLACVSTVTAKLHCNSPKTSIPEAWLDMDEPCIIKMREQVQHELNAALTYMAMGAHFSRDVINRPGFAKMFFKSASEEREHAMKIITYLLMRGQLTDEITDLIAMPNIVKSEWASGVEALRDALNLEASVTTRVLDIIKVCEKDDKFNDYHLVDYLTADFLEEQYQGQRDLAGKISTLGKMMDGYGAIGEFMYDKTLE